MPDQAKEARKTVVTRMGEYIVIQWRTESGRPIQTITLPVTEALRVAQEVVRRAGV